MSFKYSAGPQPVSTIIAAIAAGSGLTTFTIASAAGLSTVVAGELAFLRIADGTANAETLAYTISGTTIACSATGFAHAAGDAVAFDILSGAALNSLKDDAISGFPENLLTATGALVRGTGVTNRITITTAAAAFTLADGVYKGDLCRILIDRTSTKLATITAAGTTLIDGTATRIMWAGESAILAWNGTGWEKRAGKTIPMRCNMYLAADTASTPQALTTTPLNTTETDNTGLMANTGLNKATIQRSGDYITCGSAVFVSPTAPSSNIQGAVRQGATTVILSVSSVAINNFITVGGARTIPLVAGDDITLATAQNSGGTTPFVLGGKHLTFLSLTEVAVW